RAETLLDGRNKVLGNAAALHFILEDKGLFRAFRERLKVALDVGVLSAAAGLLLVLVVPLGFAGGSFAIAHLRRTDLELDLVFALDALDVDFEMQFTHAGNNGLAGLFIVEDVERRVFLAEPL